MQHPDVLGIVSVKAHEGLRMNNAFILCDFVWTVHNKHALNKEGSILWKLIRNLSTNSLCCHDIHGQTISNIRIIQGYYSYCSGFATNCRVIIQSLWQQIANLNQYGVHIQYNFYFCIYTGTWPFQVYCSWVQQISNCMHSFVYKTNCADLSSAAHTPLSALTTPELAAAGLSTC